MVEIWTNVIIQTQFKNLGFYFMFLVIYHEHHQAEIVIL